VLPFDQNLKDLHNRKHWFVCLVLPEYQIALILSPKGKKEKQAKASF